MRANILYSYFNNTERGMNFTVMTLFRTSDLPQRSRRLFDHWSRKQSLGVLDAEADIADRGH